jgi:hypothetical protein
MVFDGLNPHDKADKVLLAPKFPDVFTFFGEIKKNIDLPNPHVLNLEPPWLMTKSPCFDC